MTIRLNARGPVLLRQERMGLDGRAFTMLSSGPAVDARPRAAPVWTRADDRAGTPSVRGSVT